MPLRRFCQSKKQPDKLYHDPFVHLTPQNAAKSIPDINTQPSSDL